MRILAALFTLALFTAPAMAQSQSGSVSQSGSQASAGVNIQHGNGYRGVPSAVPPGLIASGLSCSGSASIGGSGSGWGLSFGITKEDRACNIREGAKYIHGVTGNKEAAKEMLCEDDMMRGAFLRAGYPCYEDRARRVSNTTTASVAPRRLSKSALGLSSADLRAKGCDVQRRNGRNMWVCPPGTTF